VSSPEEILRADQTATQLVLLLLLLNKSNHPSYFRNKTCNKDGVIRW